MKEIQRQEELRKFVEEEVYTNQTMLVDECLKRKLFSRGEVENLQRPFDGKLLTPNICNLCYLSFESLDSETGECKDCYSKNSQTREIYEWWVVSGFLEMMLRNNGEPMLCNEYGIWWGRTCTGQAVFLDGVISTINDELDY